MSKRLKGAAALLLLAALLAAGCAVKAENSKIKEKEIKPEKESVSSAAEPLEEKVTEPLAGASGGAEQPEKEPETPASEAVSRASEAAEQAAETAPPAYIEPPPVIHAEPASDSEFVRVKDYIPDIEVMLMYATQDNFTGEVIYGFTEAYLRYGTVKKLAAAQEVLKEKGFRLLIWDAFRPVSAQFKLWEVCPNSTYVANPNTGYSSHSRGNTVDLTLVTMDGQTVKMPTGFDDFSALADRNYYDCPEDAAENARLLENVMIEAGFTPYSGEWWHFSDNVSYPVEQSFEPES